MGAPTWEQTQPLSWGNSWHHAQCVLSKLISKEKTETSPSLSPEASLVNFTFFTIKRGIILRGNTAQPLLHQHCGRAEASQLLLPAPAALLSELLTPDPALHPYKFLFGVFPVSPGLWYLLPVSDTVEKAHNLRSHLSFAQP